MSGSRARNGGSINNKWRTVQGAAAADCSRSSSESRKDVHITTTTRKKEGKRVNDQGGLIRQWALIKTAQS